MNMQEKIAEMNRHRPAFLDLVNGELKDFDPQEMTGTLEFDVGLELCHSGNVIQGGFVTLMLDTSMAHSAMALRDDVINVATLEIKVTFLEPSNAGRFRCVAKMRKMGRSIAFMEAELFNLDGLLTATASCTAKLIRAR
jgi:uncharacterized protein (TIGR00369 family)